MAALISVKYTCKKCKKTFVTTRGCILSLDDIKIGMGFCPFCGARKLKVEREKMKSRTSFIDSLLSIFKK